MRNGMPKFCPYCFEELVRKENEKLANWENRKYCNSSCASKHSAERKGKS